jgi:hypothetical protein
MSTDYVRTHVIATYADVTLTDPAEQVLRRGNRIRQARRARRVGPALVAIAAITVGVSALPGQPRSTPEPIELVAYHVPAFPLALQPVPAELSPARFSLDPDIDGTGPGVAHASYTDTADGDSGVSLNIHEDGQPTNLGEQVGRVEVRGIDATLYESSNSDAERFVTVAWKRTPDQWVTLTGAGRHANRQEVLALAGSVTDKPTAVPLQLRVAPAGWDVVAYKEDIIITLADPRSDDPTRTLNVSLRAQATAPEDLTSQVEAVTGPVRAVDVHAQPAQLVPTAYGWYLQARLPDGETFVLQAPKDLTQAQVLAIADGVART